MKKLFLLSFFVIPVAINAQEKKRADKKTNSSTVAVEAPKPEKLRAQPPAETKTGKPVNQGIPEKKRVSEPLKEPEH